MALIKSTREREREPLKILKQFDSDLSLPASLRLLSVLSKLIICSACEKLQVSR